MLYYSIITHDKFYKTHFNKTSYYSTLFKEINKTL